MSESQTWIIKTTDINMRLYFPLRVTHSVSEQETLVPFHTHDFYEIGLFVDGGVRHKTDTGKKLLGPGTVFVMTPGEKHSLQFPPGISSYGAYFLIELFDRELVDFIKAPGMMELFFYHFLTRENEYIPCFLLSQPSLMEITSLLDKIISPPSTLTENTLQLYTKNTFLNVMLLIAAEYARQKPTSLNITNNGRLITIFILVENLIDHESNTIASVIYHRLDLSREYLLQFFKRKIGISLFDYILRRKIVRSSSLLCTDKTVTEIAQSLGFYDTAHFDRVFKRVTGMTPGRYRETVLQLDLSVKMV